MFDLFDRKNNGRIAPEDPGTCLRCLGQNPTLVELDGLLATTTAALDFTALKAVYLRKRDHAEPTFEELVEVFRVGDPHQTGLIPTGELERLCCHVGDALDVDEFKLMMKKASVHDGGVDYEDLVRRMMR